MFVIQLASKHDNYRHTRVGMFAARSGSLHAYTDKLQEAKTFDTREAAERECCENERVLTVEQAMGKSA